MIKLERGKTHRLRLVNVGSVAHQTFSIDEHIMTVIEADGTIIVPYTTTRLSIAPGQRYSVLVRADRISRGGSSWLRADRSQRENEEVSLVVSRLFTFMTSVSPTLAEMGGRG